MLLQRTPRITFAEESATGTIQNDDVPPPPLIVQFTMAAQSGSEAAGTHHHRPTLAADRVGRDGAVHR